MQIAAAVPCSMLLLILQSNLEWAAWKNRSERDHKVFIIFLQVELCELLTESELYNFWKDFFFFFFKKR